MKTPLFAGMSVALAGLLAMSLPVAAQDAVLDNLPKPSEPVKAIVGKTFKESRPGKVKIPTAPAGAPNVVIFLIDDIGFAALSTFGGPIPAPALDRLASRGVTYNDFHTTAICSPSRAAILTGRNPHAVNMGHITEVATGYDGYTSAIPNTAASVATVLKNSGYSTSAWGKWHQTAIWEVNPAGPYTTWPTGQGFDTFYGFVGGETDQYHPALYSGINAIEAPETPGYNLNDDIRERAIAWMRLQKTLAPERPFFAYIAPGATHAPHQVSRDWVTPFRGKFDQGWDKLREEIFARQIANGVIPKTAKLTPRPKEFPAWDSLNAEQKKIAARLMETYAGFAAQTDYEAGLIIDALEKMGELDNTLFIYMVGDNGASIEGAEYGAFNEVLMLNGIPEDPGTIMKNIDLIGTEKAQNHVPAPFAWALNTPFQWGKLVASHYGGTSNPVVMSWPKRITDAGGKRSQFHHVTDIAPTIYEATGIKFPKYVNGIKQQPLDGVSMAYTWDKNNTNAKTRHTTQYFEVYTNRGIYQDGWYAAAKHAGFPWVHEVSTPVEDDRWELYDMSRDFSQADNLAEKYPQKLKALQALFDQEARKYNVYPLDDRGGARFDPNNLPLAGTGRTHLVFYPGAERIPERSAPQTVGRSYTITADFDNTQGDADGVLVSQGAAVGGWSMYVKGGKLNFLFNDFAEAKHLITSPEALPKGKVKAVLDFAADAPGRGKPGVLKLSINGKVVGQARTARTPLAGWSLSDTFDVGADLGSPVGDYPAGWRFKGSLEKVTVDLK